MPGTCHRTWEFSGGGKVRYIGTRYNLGDSYATMIERGAVVPRIYPATHDGRMTGRPVFLSDEAWASTLRNSSSLDYCVAATAEPARRRGRIVQSRMVADVQCPPTASQYLHRL